LRAVISLEIGRIAVDEERKRMGMACHQMVTDRGEFAVDAESMEDAIEKTLTALRGGEIEMVATFKIEYGKII
jgi:hypothetical protein